MSVVYSCIRSISDLWPIAKSCTADDRLVLAVKLATAIRVHLSQREKERERGERETQLLLNIS